MTAGATSPVRWNEVTAAFGGTFDPPHLGHREAVQGLFQNPGVRRVLIIPAGTPPLKPFVSSTEHRYRMTELNFAGLEDVQIDYRELRRSQISGKPSFSIDTLQELRQENPQIAFVVGADQLALLHSWHRFHELLGASHWIVLARKPDGEGLAMKTIRAWVTSGLLRPIADEWETPAKTRLRLVPTQARALSSTEIREQVGRETNPETLLNGLRDAVLPEVLDYLVKHRVYGIGGITNDER